MGKGKENNLSSRRERHNLYRHFQWLQRGFDNYPQLALWATKMPQSLIAETVLFLKDTV